MSAGKNVTSLDRRQLLIGLTTAAGFAALPESARATETDGSFESIASLSKDRHFEQPVDEDFWREVKKAFPLKPGLIHLNTANLAPASKAVMLEASSVFHDVNADPSFENRARFADSKENTRRLIAHMVGADSDEIAITRNASESNRTVISGVSLGPQDEVVLWDQNHESNSVAWDVWAKRYGFKVIRVATPLHPNESTDLIAPFVSALTARTRVLSFSHVSNVSGVALPAKALCEIASSRRIMTLVDGAQTFGMMELNLHEMGCDFFTASAHKWLAGPHETGILYVRSSCIEGLAPSIVTHDWELMAGNGARKFECLGQRQEGRIDALAVAVKLQETIGRPRIERRVRDLAEFLRTRLTATGKQIDFITPAHREMNAGIVMFTIGVTDARAVREKLYTKFNISALVVPGSSGRTVVRYSPNIYVTLDELEMSAHAIDYVVQSA